MKHLNRKKNVVEICIYIVVIVLLIFGVDKLQKNNEIKKSHTEMPTIEIPTEEDEIDMRRVQ